MYISESIRRKTITNALAVLNASRKPFFTKGHFNGVDSITIYGTNTIRDLIEVVFKIADAAFTGTNRRLEVDPKALVKPEIPIYTHILNFTENNNAEKLLCLHDDTVAPHEYLYLREGSPLIPVAGEILEAALLSRNPDKVQEILNRIADSEGDHTAMVYDLQDTGELIEFRDDHDWCILKYRDQYLTYQDCAIIQHQLDRDAGEVIDFYTKLINDFDPGTV